MKRVSSQFDLDSASTILITSDLDDDTTPIGIRVGDDDEAYTVWLTVEDAIEVQEALVYALERAGGS